MAGAARTHLLATYTGSPGGGTTIYTSPTQTTTIVKWIGARNTAGILGGNWDVWFSVRPFGSGTRYRCGSLFQLVPGGQDNAFAGIYVVLEPGDSFDIGSEGGTDADVVITGAELHV